MLTSAETKRPVLRAAQSLPIRQFSRVGNSLTTRTRERVTLAPLRRTRFKPRACQKSAESKPFVLGHKDFWINELAFCSSVIIDAKQTH